MALTARVRSLPPLNPVSLLCPFSILRRLSQSTVFKSVNNLSTRGNSVAARKTAFGPLLVVSGYGHWSLRVDSRRQQEEARWMSSWGDRKGGASDGAALCRAVSSSPSPGKEVAVDVPVVVDELTGLDFRLQAVIEQLGLDAPLAVKLAIEDFEDFEQSDTVELSVMLCNDARIQELNKKWRNIDSPTDVLSFPQDQPPSGPLLLLGDLVISIETAARQAEERGHSLIDELRILLVHGLLHVLDYDHELDPEVSKEMEEEETRILSTLGWKGKGLIHASSLEDGLPHGTDGKTDKLIQPANIGPLREVLVEWSSSPSAGAIVEMETVFERCHCSTEEISTLGI